MSLRRELENYMDGLDTIDTHEHLPVSNAKRYQDTDIFREYDVAYMQNHIIVSGIDRNRYYELIHDKSRSVKERWDLVEPYWERCRYTGFGQHLDATVRILYGIPEINRETVEDVDRHIQESLRKNQYEEVLKKKCHIVTSILDAGTLDADRDYFSPVVRFDPYIRPQSYDQWLGFEKDYGRSIRRLEHLTDAFEKYLRDAAARGAVTFKFGLAIYRSLGFEKASFEEAEKGFNRMISEEGRELFPYDRSFVRRETALENYMVHFGLNVLRDLKLPLQIHTGLLAWTGNDLRRSNPELLIPLFMEYPDVKFDLFHIGWPYQHVMGGLAKMFPNVYLNMCFAHIGSPQASIRSLEEWLETVPYHKITGFGGDSGFIDGVAGQRFMAIRNIAAALSKKVENGLFTEQKAYELAKAILHDNPAELYNIKG